MPKEYRLSYPCDLFVSIQADSLDEAKKKLVDCLTPLTDGVIVCLDTPKEWKHDPAERLYPRCDGDGPIASLIALEDGPDEDEDDEEDRGGEAGAGA